jgi:two-component system, LytTR family, sensor histidine kinase AgrC
MFKIPLAISLSVLVANLTMEYGTLTRRRSVGAHILFRGAAFVLTVIAIHYFSGLGFTDTYLERCIATFPFYFSCLYLFEESIAQKTFLYFMDYSATTFLSSVCIWAGTRFASEGLAETVQSLLLIAALLLFLPLYLKRLRPRVRHILGLFKASNPLYAAFPILSFVFFVLFFGPVNVPTTLRWFGIMMLYVGLVCLIYYMLFSHFYAVYDRLQAENDVVRARRQLDLQKKYYEEVGKGIWAQNKLLHDTRHHLVALASLARGGDSQAVDQYVEGLLEVYDQPVAGLYCENAVVNAVIGGYVKMAEEKGIVVMTKLDLPAEIGIDEYELCSFFGNTLENAVEACERIPATSELRHSRFIAIEAWLEGGRLAVREENSFLDDPGRKVPGFPSSKGSGIGLESMRAVVEKYRGSMSCERRGTAFVLSAVFCPES